MSKLWTIVDGLSLTKSGKNALFIVIAAVICAVAGAVIWAAFGRLLLPGYDWLICFMGYPAVLGGMLGGILYIYNHDFS